MYVMSPILAIICSEEELVKGWVFWVTRNHLLDGLQYIEKCRDSRIDGFHDPSHFPFVIPLLGGFAPMWRFLACMVARHPNFRAFHYSV